MTKFSIPLYIFTGLAAIAMAGVAAFFSITGLAALYAAAAVPVIVMGSCIEFSKIISTVWLHHFWKKSNFLMVGALLFMVVASMAVTSGGVYGYLTGSHASQEAPNQQKEMVITRYDQQIKVENDKVARFQERLKSLDGIVTTSMTQGTRGGVSADRINRRQSTERKQIQDELDATYKRIDELSAQKLTVSQEQAESEAKLGAVKYLAALFGADPSNAVMYFTLIMVLLLDPFAIILVIATQIAYDHRKLSKDPTVKKGRTLVIPEITPEVKEILDTNDDETLGEALDRVGFVPSSGDRLVVEEIPEPASEPELEIKEIEPEPEVQSTPEKIVDFFNDEEVKESINQAEDETIVKIDEVVNTRDISDNEKVEQVIQALKSTLPPERIEEVKKRWLD